MAMIDYSAMYNEVYDRLGVPATLTAGTAGEITLTVIDDTRLKTSFNGNIAVSSVGPGAFVRIPELTEKGIARSDWIGSTLAFNGRTWIVREAPVQGNPNGEDLGEVLFLLQEAAVG